MAGINFIRRWVMGQMKKTADDGIMITLTDPKKVDFQTASGLVRSMLGGKIKPETMKKLSFVINKGNKLQFLRLVDLMYKK